MACEKREKARAPPGTMPPKTPSAAWPRRNPFRTTARKSTPTVAPTKSTPTVAPTKSTSNSAADSSPGTPPPSAETTTTTSPEPAPSLTSPYIATTPEYFPRTTPTFSARDAASKADSKSAPNETNLKNSEESRDPIPEKETVEEKASETAAIEASVPKSVGQSGQERKRTVVKKTVRLVKKVVKKVVKKKVPKTVQKGQPVSSSEDSGKMLVMNNENQNPYPRILCVVEIKNSDSVESDSLEVVNLKTEPIVSVSIEVEKKPFSSDIFVSMEDENPISEEAEAAAVGGKDTANGNLSEAPVADVVEAKTITNEGDSTTETQLGDQNVGGVRNQNEEHETENVDSGGGEGGGVKEEVEEFDVGDLKREVGMGDGLLLRGEMEALERQKRRKTEIFVGGLDKDAKEVDIRTVFQEVGEIMEVRLVMKDNTGKNKGFAFVRYASASDAKKALTKFAKVEICGKQCGAVPVEGNDTIFLGNIDKKWKSEDIVKLLQEMGIEKIDKVTVVADPSNIECNRGFAFLEIETTRDAQIAYRKLQKKDVFGKHLKIKVAWAEPLSEPDEEEMLKVKSVYAEYLPSSWDEEKVKDYFKKFGDIENVVLARNLRSSKRKDFAFVKYASREAALACIEAFSLGSLNDEGSKVQHVNVKVSLAKPLPKGKQIKHVSDPVSKELPEAKMKPAQPVIKPHQPRNKGKNATSNYDDVGLDRRSSTTSELVQLLREQASWRQPQMGLGGGSVDKNYPYFSPGRKRQLSQLGDYPHYSDPRGYTRPRFESSFPATGPSHRGLSQGIGMTSFPYNHQQGAGYVPGSQYGAEDYPNSLQTRGGVPHHGSSGLHRRCK